MRIAVLGGSFDPVHNGHLAIAKQALKHLPIDAVWFMPTRDTPLKERVIVKCIYALWKMKEKELRLRSIR